MNTTGFEQKPSVYSASGSVVFAEAKTSAGAPCRIWAASAFDPANEKRACGAIFGKASVSDAAAKTVAGLVSTCAAAVPATT